MGATSSSPPRAEPQRAEFATVADGQRAQVVTLQVLPAHLSSSAHEGRMAHCRCRPLLEQTKTLESWTVTPRGAREACTQEEHELRPLRVVAWPTAPAALTLQAYRGAVRLLLTMCCWCGAVEVRDTSFHAPAGLALGQMHPRRRSSVLGWYAGARPRGRVYT